MKPSEGGFAAVSVARWPVINCYVTMESRKEEREYSGIGASPGIAHGPVSILREKEIAIPKYQVEIEHHHAEVAALKTLCCPPESRSRRFVIKSRAVWVRKKLESSMPI